jgi:uncharacterized protein
MYTRGTVLYNPAKIPANTYPWQKETVNTVASTSFIFVNKSLPSEQVYKLAIKK